MRNTNQWFLNLLNQFIEITTLDLTKLDRVRCETMGQQEIVILWKLENILSPKFS